MGMDSVGGGRTIVGVANSKNTNVIVVCCVFYKNKITGIQALYYRDRNDFVTMHYLTSRDKTKHSLGERRSE